MTLTVRVTVLPEAATALTEIAPPEVLVTENVLVPAVVVESVSLKVRVKEVPAEFMVAADKEGEEVSITKALFALKEPEAPTVGKVSVALFVAESRMVPPFKASELVET